MNTDILAGNWKQLTGKIKQEWGELTDNEITKIDGSQEELRGRLQEKYGYGKEEAQEAINNFLKKHQG